MSIYDTKIDARGSRGNIFAVIGTARALLKELGHPQGDIDELHKKVRESGSYDEAIAHVEKYFRVVRD